MSKALTISQLLGNSSEWYTPSHILDAAREVLGGVIVLDPASCEQANARVRATIYFTMHDNSLLREWNAETVWLNPPYGTITNTGNGRSNIALFTGKLIREYYAGNVKAAIALVRADPGAKWFHPLWHFPICFSNVDLSFERDGLPPTRHRHGTAFVYLGPDEQKFIRVFSPLGEVVKAVKR